MSSVEYMNEMFFGATSFNGAISSWDVSAVTDMSSMFSGATSFDQDISNWDVSSVEYMNEMFSGATSFNQNISDWDVSSVESMDEMFKGVSLSIANYEALLVGWNNQLLQPNVTFDGGSSYYCSAAAESARANMIASDNWTIADSGKFCNGAPLTDHFVLKIRTTAANESFTFYTNDTRYHIDWDNNEVFDDIGVSGNQSHIFPVAGDHIIRFQNLNNIYINFQTDRLKYISIEQWGTSVWDWNADMSGAFAGAANLVGNYVDTPDMSQVINMSHMFEGASSFNQDLHNWDVSNVRYMNGMFKGASSFDQDLSNWDVSSVTDMQYMFANASNFNSDISGWNVSSVTNMVGMFLGGSNFDQDLSNWLISGVTSMDNMLEGVVLSTANYDALLVGWNSQVLKPNVSFNGGSSKYCSVAAESARAHMISSNSWSITDGGTDCIRALTDFVTTWKTDNPGASNNTSITIPTNGSGYNYDIDWDNDGTFDEFGITGDITHDFGTAGTYTIRIQGSFPEIYFNNSGDRQKLLSVDQWGSQVWRAMEKAFYGAINLNITASDVPDLTVATSLASTFRDIPSFNSDIISWNVSNVTDMSDMFKNASSFNRNLSNWDFTSVTNMSGMFNGATSFNQDVGLWGVVNVTDMTEMFKGITLSQTNYEALFDGWQAQNVQSNVVFDGGNSKYCSDLISRQDLIDNKGWIITDGGEVDCNTGAGGNGGGGVAPGAVIPQELPNSEFITTWKTDNAGTSNDTSITIPTFGAGYDYEVDWDNDGTFDETGITGDVTHDFGTAGTYTIQIKGDFPRITLGAENGGDRLKLIEINQWGRQKWKTMYKAFEGASNLKITATDKPDLSEVTSFYRIFANARSFNSDVSRWNTNNVADMSYAFYNARQFDQPLNHWDTKSVTRMTAMFSGASNFNQSLTRWSTESVVDMSYMFANARNFNEAITSWNTSRVGNMDSMFYLAASFNQNIDRWNVGLVTSMRSMFNEAVNFNQPLDLWNTENVTNLEQMFSGAESFDQDLSNWEVTQVGSMWGMFAGVRLSTPNYDALLNSWDAQRVRNGINLDGGDSRYCKGKEARESLKTEKDWEISDGGYNCGPSPTDFVTTWKTNASGTTNPKSIKIKASNGDFLYDVDWNNDGDFDQLGILGDVTHVYNKPGIYTVRIRGKFPRINFANTPKILSVDQWGAQKWTTMQEAFMNDKDIKILALDTPDLSEVTSMSAMFKGATNFNNNINNWDVSHVMNMSHLFNWVEAFNQPLDLWHTEQVTNMEGLFKGAKSFNQTLKHWDTSKVTNMKGMFDGATNFNRNIGDWKVMNVTDMAQMFRGVVNFNQNISRWEVGKVTRMEGMFKGAQSFNQNLSHWDITKVQNMQGMFDGVTLALVNYDALLNSWGEQSVQSDINFSGGNSKYCEGESAHTNLAEGYGWNITDGGMDCTKPEPVLIEVGDASYAWWSYPIPSWYVNPSADPESGFVKMRMKAKVLNGTTIDTTPLFAPDNRRPSIVLVHFMKDDTEKEGFLSQDLSSRFDEETGEGFSIKDNIQFEFEVNTAKDTLTDGTPLESFLSDGKWAYEVLLCMGGDSNNSCDGGTWYKTSPRTFNIDQTEPKLGITYNGQKRPDLQTEAIQKLEYGFAWRDGEVDPAPLGDSLISKLDEREVVRQNIRKVEEKIEAKDYEIAQLEQKKVEQVFRANELVGNLKKLNFRIKQLEDIIASPTVSSREKGIARTELLGDGIESEGLTVEVERVEEELYGTEDTAGISAVVDGYTLQIDQLKAELEALKASRAELSVDDNVEQVIQEKEAALEAIKADATNDFIKVVITCEDKAAGCLNDTYVLKVKGNFCDNPIVCDTTGIRKLKICDKVGNCIDPETNQNEIDWYDIVPPRPKLQPIKDEFKAGDPLLFNLTDGISADKLDLRRANDSILDDTLEADYNTHACGVNADSPLFKGEKYCEEREQACAGTAVDRGTQKSGPEGSDFSACTSGCPPGFLEENGICVVDCGRQNFNLCLPAIVGRGDCISDPSSWLPERTGPGDFVQVDNCGNQRQAP